MLGMFFLHTYVAPASAAENEQMPSSDKEFFARIELEQKEFEKQRLHLMDLLFPKSALWSRYEDLPPATFDATARKYIESKTASLDFHPTEESGFKFYRTNDPRPGAAAKQGLLYSGGVSNGEGKYTFVWPDYPKGSPKILNWVLTLMRVKQGSSPAFVGWATGCCADQFEAFYRADLVDPDGAEIVRSSKVLELPEDMIDGRFFFMLNLGATVRYSPKIDDAVAPDPEDPVPEIGNIERKFNGIFDVASLAAYVDKDAHIWILIQTSPTDDASASYTDQQGPTDIGWIDADSIHPAPGNAPILAWIDKLKQQKLHEKEKQTPGQL